MDGIWIALGALLWGCATALAWACLCVRQGGRDD